MIDLTNVGFFFLLLFCLSLSVFAWLGRNMLLGILSGAAWIGMLSYNLSNPPGAIVHGDNTDSIIVLVMIGMAIAVPFLTIQRARGRDYKLGGNDNLPPEKALDVFRESKERRYSSRGNGEESAEEYQARIRSLARRRR